MKKEDRKRVSEVWSSYAQTSVLGKSGLYWWEAGPEIDFRINRNISGDQECDYTTYTLEKYFQNKLPFEYCLSLGCGGGSLERSLARQGAFQQCDAYDIADGAIEVAKSLAAEHNYGHINYQAEDINTLDLPSERYDSVWIQGAMHHFENLEHICGEIDKSLKLDGLLILNEYVGPNRFQFPERQREIVNLCLYLLPRKYRTVTQQGMKNIIDTTRGLGWYATRLFTKIKEGDLLNTIRNRIMLLRRVLKQEVIYKEEIKFPTVGDVIAADPTEAVRSEEIISLVGKYFDIVEKKDLGGSILQFLLDGIAAKFSKEDQDSQDLLRLLITIEETLMRLGELESDFAYVVARKRIS